jgi:malonate transporter and related proteins
MPLVLTVLELGAGKDGRAGALATSRMIAKRLATNPIILAIAMGLTLAAFDVRLPTAVSGTLELLGKASAGAALFFVGASLVGSRFRGDLISIAQMTSFKLIVHPLLVAAMIAVLPAFAPNLQQAAVLIAACPMLSIFPILTSRYGYTQFASSALLITTTISFVTLSVVLANL